MEETANTILTKLNLVDPTLSPFSAYQQSAEIRQLWTSVESSIKTILSVISSTFSTDPIDVSSQIITVLSASTLLSSIIHAIISTQKRINKSDENIENIIQKETQVILYHIQILKQDIHQSFINAESAQEAIIHHTNILVDSLVAYTLTPSNTYQIHPYKVSPSSSTSFFKRHSQPAHCISSSSSNEELSSKTLNLDHREKSGNTVGKKFLQSINSLKQRPAFNKTLLPNRHTLQPSNSEQPPNKKRIFFDRIHEEESDDESTSSNNSNSRKGGNATLRFILNGGRQQKNQSSTNAKKASKAMKQVFPSKDIQPEFSSNGRKKRESISTFFNHSKKESIPKEKKQDSFYSSSTISSSSESMTKHLQPSTKIDERPHLVSPFSKKTDIQWSSQIPKSENKFTHENEFYRVESIHNDDEDQDSEGSYNPTATSLNREKSRKRRSNGSLISPITMKDAPLPPLPTVENFLAIMDASSPPNSPYFSARSSSQSTLDSVLLDDLTDSMASAHIMEPCLSTESSTSSNSTSSTDTIKQDELLKTMSIPPPVPPKDQPDLLMKKKRASAVEMRVSTNDMHRFASPKSADNKQRSFVPPPRRSSMPLPPPSIELPPMPLNAKQITDAYNDKKITTDESSWSSLLGMYKKEEPNNMVKKAKLRRSLGSVPKKNKKSDKNGNQMLKVTENGQVVLLYEMINGKFQVMAGTPERLFEKLADETAQDTYFIDTYIMHHTSFTDSDTFLNQLICRFHLGPSPGEYEYFRKWQHSIQTKVLNVIDRWISIQYQDFKQDINLQKKLNMFLFNNDIVHFKQHIHKIQQNLNHQITHTPSMTAKSSTFSFQFPFVDSTHHTSSVHSNNPRRPSNGIFNLTSTDPVVHYPIPTHTSLVSLESKDIARYLTLADFYLLRSILSSGALNNNSKNKDTACIELMTKRANMLSHWVVHEICSLSYLKPKRSLVKKFIEIAKLCLEINNYHTCMVLTMGLASAPKLTGVWESLSSRDMNTFTTLQKLLDVSMNMRHYRHKIQLAKSPCVPFLPVILKDQTFFNENATFLVSHPNLINFAKFTSIRQFIDRTKEMTSESYWFSNDLTHYPFLPSTKTQPMSSSSLDHVADWVEHRLAKIPDYYDQ